MIRITILLIIGLSAGVFAKPYENNQDSNISTFDSNSERSVDKFLIELYEKLLQIQPYERPVLEDQPAKFAYDTKSWEKEGSSDDLIAPEVIDRDIRSTAATKKEDRFDLEKDSSGAVDHAEKKAKLDKAEGQKSSPKEDELSQPKKDSVGAADHAEKKAKLDKAEEKKSSPKKDESKPRASRAEKSRPNKNDAAGNRPGPKGEGKRDDKKDKYGKHPEQSVAQQSKKENPPPKPLPLVQINVNVGKK